MEPMEANDFPISPAPVTRRPKRHPAQRARKVAAAVSAGTFVALTGGFALGQALSHPASTSSNPTTVATNTSGTGTSTGTVGGWDTGGAQPGSAGPSGPATTQSRGS